MGIVIAEVIGDIALVPGSPPLGAAGRRCGPPAAGCGAAGCGAAGCGAAGG
jgi:hypothetical protein